MSHHVNASIPVSTDFHRSLAISAGIILFPFPQRLHQVTSTDYIKGPVTDYTNGPVTEYTNGPVNDNTKGPIPRCHRALSKSRITFHSSFVLTWPDLTWPWTTYEAKMFTSQFYNIRLQISVRKCQVPPWACGAALWKIPPIGYCPVGIQGAKPCWRATRIPCDCVSWSPISKILAWWAWRLPGRWQDGGRRLVVARWMRRSAPPMYGPTPDLTLNRRLWTLVIYLAQGRTDHDGRQEFHCLQAI